MSPSTTEIIKQDIIDQLTWDNRIDANDVYVSVRDGVVILQGTVPSYAAKVAAEKDAYQVDGVNRVENELKVEFPPETERPDDQEITENIEKKLIWNSQVNSANISVQTVDGVVSLTGSVDSFWEKIMAEDIAQYTHGVTDVINRLLVSVTKSVLDIDIEKDIKNTYKRSGLLAGNEDDLTVSVTNGIVRLSGVVPSYPAKRQAYNIAKYTSGVVDVIDDLSTG